MKYFYSILAGLLASTGVSMAQPDSIPGNVAGLSIGADVVSRYVWRGMSLSTAPCIQPVMELNWGNLTLGTWGSYSFNSADPQEVDLYATYSLKNITIGLYDYYNPVDSMPVSDFFVYSDVDTRHAVEGTISITGPESFPVQFVAGTFLYGSDRDEFGKHYYSTYFELNYTFSLGTTELNAFLGATPHAGMYNDSGFGFVNSGISANNAIRVNECFTIPVGASLNIDPTHKNVFMVFKITL